ncbi:TraB/GumN family protein [Aurantiacibacter gangjinensis]|uniref:TraB/GumN family protein n=1 Tax=Aurantiacibacter gangjinensis TaxID=502682 RepID=UPI00090C352A|nr:TraB/GumN family protein [Aurantiacibacter gangjinensis]APE28714.1 lipoprotein, putative [Aurantiacibacter gangjinensis]
MALGGLWLASCSPLERESEWPDASPPIWEITGEDGQQGWLFGTVHALPDEVYWGTHLLDDTFENAGVLVVEVADLDASGGQALIADLSATPGQPPLLQRVEPSEREVVEQLVADADMHDRDFSETETWAAALMLSGAVRIGDPANGVDRELIAAADEVIGLEGFAAQLVMFDRLSEEAQSDLLHNVARAHAANSENGMLRAWLSGDDAALDAQINAAMADSPELRRILLTDRNRAWTRQIAQLIEQGRRPFVAVGAGHTVGNDGVVAMLRESGFTVERIQ